MVWDRVGGVRVRGPGLEGQERRQGIPKLPHARWGEGQVRPPSRCLPGRLESGSGGRAILSPTAAGRGALGSG